MPSVCESPGRGTGRDGIQMALHGFLGPTSRLTPLDGSSYTSDGAVGFLLLAYQENHVRFIDLEKLNTEISRQSVSGHDLQQLIGHVSG